MKWNKQRSIEGCIYKSLFEKTIKQTCQHFNGSKVTCSSVVECQTHDLKVVSSNPVFACVLCPWARHFITTHSSQPKGMNGYKLGWTGNLLVLWRIGAFHNNIIYCVVWPNHQWKGDKHHWMHSKWRTTKHFFNGLPVFAIHAGDL